MLSKLIGNRRFMLLWSSQILSQVSINIMNFLVLVHLYQSTGSSVVSSLVWVAYGLPSMMFGPLAAAAVDTWDKRKVLSVANFIQAMVIFSLSFLYLRYIYLAYAVVLLYSLMDQFYVPAEAATLPTLVSKSQLAQANGLFFVSSQASAIFGFGLAGLVAEIIGFGQTMLVVSFMLLIATFATLSLPKLKVKAKKVRSSIEKDLFDFFDKIKEGYYFIRDKKSILYPFLYLMWLQISLSMIVVILPAIGEEIVMVTPSLAGVLVIFPAGIGALAGSALAPTLMKRYRIIDIAQTALMVFTTCFLTVSLLVPVLPFWTGRTVLVACFFFVGVSYVSSLVPALTFLQRQTPKRMMGRLFGNFWFLTNSAILVPVLLSASITDVLGTRLMLFVMAAIAFCVLVYIKTGVYPLLSGMSIPKR